MEGPHRELWLHWEPHRALLCLHLCSQEGERAALWTTELGSSLTRTLRADPPSEQQVHSKVSLRRGVNAV